MVFRRMWKGKSANQLQTASAVEGYFWQYHESACATTAKKNGSTDQCVCTQQNDKSRHACIRKNLTNVRNGELCPNFDLFNNASQSIILELNLPKLIYAHSLSSMLSSISA
jgi:hypothetical protein